MLTYKTSLNYTGMLLLTFYSQDKCVNTRVRDDARYSSNIISLGLRDILWHIISVLVFHSYIFFLLVMDEESCGVFCV